MRPGRGGLSRRSRWRCGRRSCWRVLTALDNQQVAANLAVMPATVGKWRRRFVDQRLDGLWDEPRPGGPRTIGDERIEAVIVATLERTPKDATHWSRASMAAETGLSRSTIGRIWQAFRLKPHLADTFKLSYRSAVRREGPRRGRALSRSAGAGAGVVRGREERHPGPRPVRAVVTDDAGHARAAHPRLRPRRYDHVVRRAGCCLGADHRVAAPAPSRGGVPQVPRQDRHRVPAELDVHLICDNLVHPQNPVDHPMAAAHPRFHLHFTPTSSSWLNQVERWFGLLTDKQLRRRAQEPASTRERHPRLGRQLERQPATVRLDQDRRPDLRTTALISSTDSRRRTLVPWKGSSLALGDVQVCASQGRRGRDTGSYLGRGERREVRAWAPRSVKRFPFQGTRRPLS